MVILKTGSKNALGGSGESAWCAPFAPSSLRTTVRVPGSKSLMARELILSALADGPGRIINPLISRDSALMIQGLRALGVDIQENRQDLEIMPVSEFSGAGTIDCGLAGTVMRFLPPIAALASGPVAFDGDEYARKRPMRELLYALREIGVNITDDGRGALPFTIHGTGSAAGGKVTLDAGKSSQFVSALLLAAPRFEHGIEITHTGEHLPSVPHIEMTLESLRARGIDAESMTEISWQVRPGKVQARDISLEPDLSNAAPFLAAALICGGSVSIPNWPEKTTQVGDKLREYLVLFGGLVDINDNVLTVTGTGNINGVDLNLAEAGELAPNLVGLAALANSPSKITGISHLRGHETDRITALVTEINRLGGNATELTDGIEIKPAPLHGGLWHAYADHRMATTGALIGLKTPGVEIDDIACTSKTMPDFPKLWQAMLTGNCTLEKADM